MRVLLTCYGGGHAQIIARLWDRLIELGHDVEVIALTMAYPALEVSGYRPSSVQQLLNPRHAIWTSFAEQNMGTVHPELTFEDSLAYHAIGLADLAHQYGADEAERRFQEHGRLAFLPLESWKEYLSQQSFDVLVATTSPRFERAALMAARELGIPHLAVGDWFLFYEKEWICAPGYAENIAVLNASVEQFLKDKGYRGKIVVTGNPVFDRLVMNTSAQTTQKSIFLWAAATGKLPDGRTFITHSDALSTLERCFSNYSDWSYVYRLHPNDPWVPDVELKYGEIDLGQQAIEEAIDNASLVGTEVSTVGLQAAAVGKPVVSVGFEDYVHYEKFGVSQHFDSLEDALAELDVIAEQNLLPWKSLGCATQNVVNQIIQLGERSV